MEEEMHLPAWEVQELSRPRLGKVSSTLPKHLCKIAELRDVVPEGILRYAEVADNKEKSGFGGLFGWD